VSTGFFILALVIGVFSGPVAHANPLGWEGTLSIELLGLAPLAVTGGGVATVDGPDGGAWLQTLRLAASRGGIDGTALLPITDAGLAPIASIRATASLGTASLAPISGGIGSAPLTRGTLPLRGLAKLCLFSTSCGTFLPLDLTRQTPGGGVRRHIGGCSASAAREYRFSIQGAPWTLPRRRSACRLRRRVPVFNYSSTARDRSRDRRDCRAGCQLVAPIGSLRIRATVWRAGRSRVAPAEPGWLVLLAAGLVGLGLLELARPHS
jgi:hypothetical protein